MQGNSQLNSGDIELFISSLTFKFMYILKQKCLTLTGKFLNTYGIKSTDLEDNKWGNYMKMCICANLTVKARQLLVNNWLSNLLAASSSTSRLKLAVTLSSALINNMLTLCRKRHRSIFSNSWEVRRPAGAN